MNVQTVLEKGFKELNNSKIRNPILDCEVLLSNIINKNREYFILI